MKRQGPRDSGDRLGSLPVRARLYVRGLIGFAVLTLALGQILSWAPPAEFWLVLVLVILGASGGAFEIFAPGHYSLQPNFAFLFWGALLLEPWGIAVVAVACFAPSILAGGSPGYKNAFNVANYFLTGVAISLIAALAGGIGDPAELGAAGVLALALAAALGALLNHGFIVVAIALAGEQTLRGTVHQFMEGTPLSVGVGLMGGVLALLWQADPALVLIAAGPLALMYRALSVPMLRHQATTDPKTGLFNYEHFTEEFEASLRDTQRRGRELAVVMVDLDHLRAINNRLGHLAGDRAIKAVADALGAAAAAEHGMAARFGGEEFCLLLPGFSGSQANALMHQIRQTVRKVEFRETDSRDLKVGFSAGIAVFPEHGDQTQDLLRVADEALYEAKAAGRDRIRIALSSSARSALASAVTLPEPAALEPPPVLQVPTGSRPGRMLGRLASALAPARRRTLEGDADLEQDNRRLRGLLEDNRALLATMQRSYLSTITSLARSIEAKDPYAGDHTERLARITRMLGEELGFGDDDLAALETGAVLHDIGKIGVSDSVLHKDGTLDPAEREQMRRHTEVATALVGDLELPSIVKQMVRNHHERWDGTGYPDGLTGEEIPLAARVLAVADALDAMLSDRPYRAALPVAAAHAEIRAGAGTQFCPRVVEALARCLAREPGRVAGSGSAGATRTSV